MTPTLTDAQLAEIRAQAHSNEHGCLHCRALLSAYDHQSAEIARLAKDAAWGAHNGGAHQLLKIQHATSVELYNALRHMSPNHAVVIKHYELSPEALSGTGSSAALAPSVSP